MYIQFSKATNEKGEYLYRMVGKNLLKLQDKAYIQCAVVPPGIKGINRAVHWFENEQQEPEQDTAQYM